MGAVTGDGESGTDRSSPSPANRDGDGDVDRGVRALVDGSAALSPLAFFRALADELPLTLCRSVPSQCSFLKRASYGLRSLQPEDATDAGPLVLISYFQILGALSRASTKGIVREYGTGK